VARLELEPFSDAHLEDAARLLAARHARHRESEPLLSARFEDPAAAGEEIERAWHADGASGAAAYRGGRLTGYVFAAPRDDRIWGDNVWVEVVGHAVVEADDARDLYAAAAARWVDEGRTRHYALLPATDAALIEAWFRLGFGQQQAHAIREIPEVPRPTEVRVPEGLEIRRPTEDEIGSLIEVDLALPRHQRSSPVFSDRPLPSEQDVRDEWVDTLSAEEEEVLVGYRDGKPLACWSVVDAEASLHFRDLSLPDRSCYLAFASTVPEARATGIGLALTDASLARAAAKGYRVMVTDWRVTNLLASRFWPRRGFRTFLLRLYRSIP
jgi:ribosomal protein S18 acetylase RimI-like enzyme